MSENMDETTLPDKAPPVGVFRGDYVPDGLRDQDTSVIYTELDFYEEAEHVALSMVDFERRNGNSPWRVVRSSEIYLGPEELDELARIATKQAERIRQEKAVRARLVALTHREAPRG